MFKKLLTTLILALGMITGALWMLPEVQAQPAQQFEVTAAAITGPVTIKPIETHVFTASGFAAGETVEIQLNNVRMARGPANGSGVFTSSIQIPRSILFGNVTVKAKNDNNSANSSYTASLKPALVTSAASGTAGAPLNVSGYGFSNGEVYTVTFTNQVDTLQATCVATTATVTASLGGGTVTKVGSFSLDSTVPSVPPGTYYVVAHGSGSVTCAVK
jgi:hypothetical protein